jgi:hypothetical protein
MINFGFTAERAGYADALALAARKLVRIAVRSLRVEPDEAQQLGSLIERRSARGAIDDRSPGR